MTLYRGAFSHPVLKTDVARPRRLLQKVPVMNPARFKAAGKCWLIPQTNLQIRLASYVPRVTQIGLAEVDSKNVLAVGPMLVATAATNRFFDKANGKLA